MAFLFQQCLSHSLLASSLSLSKREKYRPSKSLTQLDAVEWLKVCFYSAIWRYWSSAQPRIFFNSQNFSPLKKALLLVCTSYTLYLKLGNTNSWNYIIKLAWQTRYKEEDKPHKLQQENSFAQNNKKTICPNHSISQHEKKVKKGKYCKFHKSCFTL